MIRSKVTVNDISEGFANDVIIDEQLFVFTTQVVSSQWDQARVIDNGQAQDSLQKLGLLSRDVVSEQTEREHVLVAGQPRSVMLAIACLLQQLLKTCHM